MAAEHPEHPRHEPHHGERHHGDPVGHHTEAAAKATGLKKKIGPLPMWSWILIIGGTLGIFLLYRKSAGSTSASTSGNTVDPNNPLGLTYAQEQADIAEGIDPNTGESYASEQAAADTAATSGDSGGDTGTSNTGTTDGTTPEHHQHGQQNNAPPAVSPAINITNNIPATASPANAAPSTPVLPKNPGIASAGLAGAGAGASDLGKAAPKVASPGSAAGKGAQDLAKPKVSTSLVGAGAGAGVKLSGKKKK